MQWYYQDETRGQNPFDENYIAALSSDKRIKPTTLVWNDTLSGWIPAAEAFPEAFPGAAMPPSGVSKVQSQGPVSATPAQEPGKSVVEAENRGDLTHKPVKIKNQEVRELVKDLASYFGANRFWINSFGIILILVGVVLAITVFGILIAWLPIWAGILLIKASGAAAVAEKTGAVETLAESVYRFGLFFRVNGIFALIVALLYLAAVVLWILMILGIAFQNGIEGLPGTGSINPFGSPSAQ